MLPISAVNKNRERSTQARSLEFRALKALKALKEDAPRKPAEFKIDRFVPTEFPRH